MKTITEKILALKKEKNAVILAHYYQEEAIQDLADYVGDSLGLSQKAAETEADIIVFAGVHFMAETAKILSPNKKVFLPDLKAGCSLAESCPPDTFGEFVKNHPDHVVITYVNCSAEIKALSDIVCTSSNALKIVESIPKDKPIIFAPDKNLGKYIISKTGRDMLLWDGACVVHEAFSLDKLLKVYADNPGSKIIAHPECPPEVIKASDFAGSTSGMINYVKDNQPKKVMMVTECSMSDNIQVENPNVEFIRPCNMCPHMKKITLPKILDCLENETGEIIMDQETINKARLSVEKMVAIGR